MSQLLSGKVVRNRTPSETILVRPRRHPLDGLGNIWEWLLFEKGWNDIPPEKRIGEVVALYADEYHPKEPRWCDVYFPAIDSTATCIAVDEVFLVDSAANEKEIV